MTSRALRPLTTPNTYIPFQTAGMLPSSPTQWTHQTAAAAVARNKAKVINSPSLPAKWPAIVKTARNSSFSLDKTMVMIKSSELSAKEMNRNCTWTSKNTNWALTVVLRFMDKIHRTPLSSAPTNWRTMNWELTSVMETFSWLPMDTPLRSLLLTSTAMRSMDCAEPSMEMKMMTRPHPTTRSTLMPTTLLPHGL